MEEPSLLQQPQYEVGESLEGTRRLPLNLVAPNPRQNRQAFDAQALEELADSIRQEDVLQPILVRSQKGRRFIYSGGSRQVEGHPDGQFGEHPRDHHRAR